MRSSLVGKGFWLAVLSVIALLGGCTLSGRPASRAPTTASPATTLNPTAAANTDASAGSIDAGQPPANCSSPQLTDQEWARCALQVLDQVDAAVAAYHSATTFASFTPQYRQLQSRAFTGFNQALDSGQALLPATRQVHDSADRDQFVFVLGNIGGFLHPTPDIPGDPGGPTLGDRIGRSLDNTIKTSASLRPRLQVLATAR